MAMRLDLDDIQGLVVRGYGRLQAARFLLLRIEDPAAARRWLAGAADSVTPGSSDPRDASMQVAFTHAGLRGLGLGDEALGMFPPEFVGGMATAHRSRILGDFDQSAPEDWSWGGPATPPIHLALLLYASDETTLATLVARYERELAGGGLVVERPLKTVHLGIKEHFGFHDGISQPVVEGLPRTGSPEDTIKAGEIVLGYPNEYNRYTDRPLLEPVDDPDGLLPRDPAGSGAPDLGRNGSYLVVRQLQQHVRELWDFMDRATRRPDGGPDEAARLHLAAKMVGRWPSGAPLVLAPDEDQPALADANDFGYHDLDADGRRCPLGAHIRRAHPRDSLDPEPGTPRSIAVDKRHRILRRGRGYGRPLATDAVGGVQATGEDEERGLHFMCLNANIARQFEFIQHTWVNNPKFGGLYDDPDPIVIASGQLGSTFTMPADPLRTRVTGIPPFVTVRGGAYFFLPGIRAVRYLASLRAS
jgi:Dyp-type peroxidase family